MPALARFGALGHFDLQFLRAVQVGACYTESAGSNLLDGGAAQRVRKTLRRFAAFAGVRFSAKGIHGNRKAFVRLLGN